MNYVQMIFLVTILLNIIGGAESYALGRRGDDNTWTQRIRCSVIMLTQLFMNYYFSQLIK